MSQKIPKHTNCPIERPIAASFPETAIKMEYKAIPPNQVFTPNQPHATNPLITEGR